jgi:hypothetical protein
MHGQGIPVRAILDELRRVGAIQLVTPSQKILPKVSLPINPSITHKKIKDFDATAKELLSGLLSPGNGTFVERVSGTRAWSGSVRLTRKRSGPNAIELLRELQSKLTHKQAKHAREDVQKLARLRVSIVYVEALAHLAKHSSKSRRNLHRNR